MNLKRFIGRDFVTALVAVVLGLLAGAVLMALIGRNPISGYVY
ncbi:MAG: ABC transporter permease, partial [Clostridiales bacterium]|nr:ABC transporter permease [Clostridiales bacterium]